MKEVKDVRPTPYPLMPGFEWVNVDISDPKELDDVYKLLYENYVEDDEGTFRFDYSRDFLKWALTPPGFVKDWIFGVRVSSNRRLVGFITGIPVNLVLDGKEVRVSEINFLCVHKKIRAQRLAPVLIKEVTRRVNLAGIWQAIYTAGRIIPTPFCDSRYFHRSLNPKKLIEIGFCGSPKRSSLSTQIKLYMLPEKPIHNFRPIKEPDVKQVRTLLNDYLK